MTRQFGLKPVWWLLFMSLCMFLGQSLANSSEDFASLGWATSVIGFAYGQFFGISPIILLFVFA